MMLSAFYFYQPFPLKSAGRLTSFDAAQKTSFCLHPRGRIARFASPSLRSPPLGNPPSRKVRAATAAFLLIIIIFSSKVHFLDLVYVVASCHVVVFVVLDLVCVARIYLALVGLVYVVVLVY